jgi:hypothetical protein
VRKAIPLLDKKSILFYKCSFISTISGFPLRAQRQTGRPDPLGGPVDDAFLEALVSALCRDLFVLPGETFVDQVRRWTDALAFAAALKPRDRQEWLQAADVTMKQFAAIQSLVLRKRRGITRRQRAAHEHDFLRRAREMQDARLRYDLLWKSQTP